jgi:hypothetical protein
MPERYKDYTNAPQGYVNAYFACLVCYVISQFVVPPASSWKGERVEMWSGGWRESEPVLNRPRQCLRTWDADQLVAFQVQ